MNWYKRAARGIPTAKNWEEIARKIKDKSGEDPKSRDVSLEYLDKFFGLKKRNPNPKKKSVPAKELVPA